MKKLFISHRKFVAECAAVFLFLLLSVLVLGQLVAVTRTETEELFLTPIFTDACGWELYMMENESRRELTPGEIAGLDTGEVFYLTRVLTAEQEKAGYTFLLLDIVRPCAVFIDGELLYTTCPRDDMRMDAVSFPADYTVTPTLPGEAVRCTLPAPYAGRRLTIATAHVYDSSMPAVRLSSRATESEPLIADTGKELMPAAGFAVIALLLLSFWLFTFLQGIRDYPSLLLVAAALIRMFSHLRQFRFLIPTSASMGSPLEAFIPVVELFLPLVWLLLQMDGRRNRRIFGGILGICTAISLIVPVAGLFGGLPFYSRFLDRHMSMYFALAALVIFAVLEAKAGNREFHRLLSGLGITVLTLFAIYLCSMLGEGFYANLIATVLNSMLYYDNALFFRYCAAILFVLTAILALYRTIQRITWMHADLMLQTEHARQLDSQLVAQRDFYEARLSHEQEIRALRHDMAGHLNTLAALLREDQTAEARKYLSDITEYHKEQTAGFFSTNPYINAVLQNYAAKCRKQHIDLTCHIGTGEYTLPATELCLILNNALENALEGSLTMPETDRAIKVQAAVRQDIFLLRVSNRFTGQLTTEHGLPVSTKEGKEHGYGLSNIRQAAGRRGGQMEYHVQDGYFVLDVSFPVLLPGSS